MSIIDIKEETIKLKLTSPRSKIRICDDEGNHVARPSSEKIRFSNSYIEWMITNNELIQIIIYKFSKQEVRDLIKELKKIKISLRVSDYYSRAAQKQKADQVIADFSIYKYEEVFYSFEKNIDQNLKVKITFKMGDYTLAAHMFVLIGLDCQNIKLENNEGNIKDNGPLGSGARCYWNPSRQTIIEIAKALSHSSKNHKNDVINLLKDL
jgi:hypothetical protein